MRHFDLQEDGWDLEPKMQLEVDRLARREGKNQKVDVMLWRRAVKTQC